LVQAVALLTCIREVHDLNCGQNTVYSDWSFCSFVHSVQENFRTAGLCQLDVDPLPSTALAIDSIGSVKYSLSSPCTFSEGI